MIALYTLLLVAAIGPGVFVALRKRRFYSAFVVLLAYYCLQIPFLLIAEIPYQEGDVFRATIYAAIANAILSGCIIFGERNLDKIAEGVPVRQNRELWLLIGFWASALVFLAGKYGQGAAGLENVWEQREYDFGFLTAALTYIGFLLFVLWTPLPKFWKLVTLPFLIFVFITTGARVMFMVIAGYFFYAALKRYRLRTIFAASPIALGALLAVHIVGRTARSVGARALLTGDFSGLITDLTSDNLDFTGGEGGIAEAFILSQQLQASGIWDSPPFTTLLRILLLPVPTSLIGVKPPDITYTLWGQALQAGFFDFDTYFASLVEAYSLGQNGSLHPIIWGDAVLNAGWFGCVLWPVLLALGLFTVERALIKYRDTRFGPMLAGLAAPAFVYIIRGNVFLGVAFFVLLPVLWYLAYPRMTATEPRLATPSKHQT